MDGHYLTINESDAPKKSVLIAMSGGVDSAVTALLVKQAGYRAVALTMKNYCYGDADVPDRSCCSVEAITDAKRECDRLGIPHRVVDVEEFFTREVIDNFLGEYESARTPNPCVRCNSIVRFQTLIDYADKLGMDYVATGHYARIYQRSDGKRFLARAVNRRKDQSYFLSAVRGDALERVLFPLGEYVTKDEVRSEASRAKIAVADKKDSQEVCFVPDGTLKSFLLSRGVEFRGGAIENTAGEVIGQHDGLASYTVGQRRGVGVAAGRPQYVVALDRKRNVLVVGEPDELLSGGVDCRFTWLDSSSTQADGMIRAQIRYRHEGVPVRAVKTAERTSTVEFETAQRAVCPGQTIALYRGDVVVASGVIDAPRP